MRSPCATSLAASALAIVVLVGTAGCSADAGASNPVPTSTATSSPDPTPTIGAPTSEPSPSLQPTAQPTETPVPGYGAFSFEDLTRTCVDVTISNYAPDVVFDTEGTRIEQRLVEPEWLVLVPVTTSGYEGQSVCTIGGTPADPQIELSSGSIEKLPEEQIQNLIRGENEGGDR